jgi:hypothetical protein
MSIYWKPAESVTILRYATLTDLRRAKSRGTISLLRSFLDNLACVVVSPEGKEEEVCHLKHLRADGGRREIDDALEGCALRLAAQHLARCSPDSRDSTRWIYLDENTWWSISGEALIRLGRLLARGDLHVKDPLAAWLEDERLALERVPLGSLNSTVSFRYRAPSELSSKDLPEERQPTSHANPPNDIYAACARAFNTTRDDAKKRLITAMYGGTPSEVRIRSEDSSLAGSLRREDDAKERHVAAMYGEAPSEERPCSEESSPAESLRRFQAAVDLLRGLDAQLSLYVAGGTLCLMSGPSHDEEGRPLII